MLRGLSVCSSWDAMAERQFIQMAKTEGGSQGLIWNSALRYIGRNWKWVQEETTLSTSLSASALHKYQEVSEAGATNRWRRVFPPLLLEYYCEFKLMFSSLGFRALLTSAIVISFLTPRVFTPEQSFWIWESSSSEGVATVQRSNNFW